MKMLIRLIKKHFILKTLLSITLVVLIISIISIVYFNSIYRASLLQTLYQDIENTRQIIENSYPTPLWNIQTDLIRTMNEAVLAAHPYIAIIVYDKLNDIFVVNSTTIKITNDNKAYYEHTDTIETFSGSSVTGHFEIHGEIIGKYELFYTKDQITNHIRDNLINLAISFSAISVTFILGLFVLLNKFMIKRIFSIINFAKSIAVDNDYKKRIKVSSNDEIAVLADAINDMLHKIEIKDREKDHISHELFQSKLYLQSIFDACPDAIFIHNAETGSILDVNQSMCRMYLCSREDVIGSGLGFMFQEDETYNKRNAFELLKKAKTDGQFRSEWRSTRFNGTRFWSELNISFTTIEGQNLFIVIERDITDRKLAEQQLQKMQNFLSNIINSMPSILVGVDKQTKVTHWNIEAEKFTGISASNAIGRHLSKAFPHLSDDIANIKATMEVRKASMKTRKAFSRANQVLFEDITVYPLIDNGVEGAVIRVDDVTERVRLEEMMLQNEKMLSVGGLAAGMAHEINNPLGGMIQTASVMKDRLTNTTLPANARAAKDAGISIMGLEAYMHSRGIPRMLDNIQRSGKRATEIVANMLSFARKSDSSSVHRDITKLIDNCLQLAGSDYDLKKKYDFRQIKIIKEYEADIPLVPCQSSKIQQVFLNILRNGAEAMHSNMSKDPAFIIRIFRQQEMLQIEFEDNGPGMDEEVRRRVFEPFYTTKSTDSGTGLGLSVSYFIITENHGGKMFVESIKDKGSRFIIRLPL